MLTLKNEFNAFQSCSYPAHLTALVEAVLRRIRGMRVVGRGGGLHWQRPDPGNRLALAAIAVPVSPSHHFRQCAGDRAEACGRPWTGRRPQGD